MKIFNKNPRSEDGNVLFLILIAVALFAALSYAVTQSSRSGGSGADESTSLVQSSQITQYPASVKTSVLRLQVSKGISSLNLAFNPPSFFNDLNRDVTGVFHPDGGGATYQGTISLGGNKIGPWRFVDVNIENVGDNDKFEIVAALPEIPTSVCDSINEELGLDLVSNSSSNVTTANTIIKPSNFNVASDSIVDNDGNGVDASTNRAHLFDDTTQGIGSSSCSVTTCDTPGLAGQAFGCFRDGNDTNVYYHALVER